MSTLYHEGSRQHQIAHLGVVESLAEVPVRHLPLNCAHETERLVRGRNLARPLVEITRADRKRIFFEQRRYPHRRLATITQSVKPNARSIHKGECIKPARD